MANVKANPADEYKDLLFSFIGSLTLADNMHEVTEDIREVLSRTDLQLEQWDTLDELIELLHERHITTLHGETLIDEDDEDEDEDEAETETDDEDD